MLSLHERAKDVFLAALERPAGERREYIAEACGSDAALYADKGPNWDECKAWTRAETISAHASERPADGGCEKNIGSIVRGRTGKGTTHCPTKDCFCCNAP